MLRRLVNKFYTLLGADDLISIVVPNYNNADYLASCISSMLSQTYSNIEIIIVDDKSVDESLLVVESFKDKRIRLLALSRNAGVAAARNFGINASRGLYVTTLDSDDLYTNKEKLAEEMKLIKSCKAHGENIVAFSNIVRVSEEGELMEEVGNKGNIVQGSIFDGLLDRSIFIPRDFLCHKSVYLNAGLYDEDIDIYEDWDLKLRISKDIAFYYTGLTGVGYRDRANGLSKARPEVHAEWKAYVHQKNSLNKVIL